MQPEGRIEKSAAFGGDSAFRSGAPEEIRTPDPQIRSLVLPSGGKGGW
jgi:hypothetical protein